MINIAYEVELGYGWDGDAYRPILPVSLVVGGKHADTQALVDSEADYSVFDADLALDLGLRVREGVPIPLIGLGRSALGYIHNVDIELLGHANVLPPVRAQVVFLQTAPRNMLGRRDFFRAFMVGFDEAKQKIYLGRAQ